MRIRIVNGTYGLHDGRRVVTMTARSGAFEADDAEAAALIAAGVAEACEFGVRSSEFGDQRGAPQLEVGSGKSEVKSAEPTGSGWAAGGAPSLDGDCNTASRGGSRSRATKNGNGSETEDGAEGNNSEFRIPHSELDSTVDYLTLSAAQLRELCDGRGIGYKKNASAKALRAALEQYDAEVNIFFDRLKEEVCAACEVPPDVFDAGQRLPDAESDEDGIMPELFAADPVEA